MPRTAATAEFGYYQTRKVDWILEIAMADDATEAISESTPDAPDRVTEGGWMRGADDAIVIALQYTMEVLQAEPARRWHQFAVDHALAQRH